MTPTVLIAVPTIHADWDWQTPFEAYYTIGFPQWGQRPVRTSFDQAFALLEGGTPFCYSLAEIGYFRRYVQDTPDAPARVLAAADRFCLLGGGVVSPDNLVSHGEAFIRNYLVGQGWLRSVGLGDRITLVAWLPDDFGHDPQLPATLAGMGMQSVAFWRVPSAVHGEIQSNGVAFQWKAADGSVIAATTMPDGYNVVHETGNASTISGDLSTYVRTYGPEAGYNWPGNVMYGLIGGDFATPTTAWAAGVADYVASNPGSAMGTYADYVRRLPTLPGPFTMNAQWYWTGYFASRPALKRNHYQATRDLLAAEAAVAVAAVFSDVATSALDNLADDIQVGWEGVAATTHHDFVTGTAVDGVYRAEQLPLSEQTRVGARSVRDRAIGHLAASIASTPVQDEIPVMVFNPLGTPRSDVTGVPDGPELGAVRSVRNPDGSLAPIQRGADGTLLFYAPDVPSLGYQTFYLSSAAPTITSPCAVPPASSKAAGLTVGIGNSVLSADIDLGHQGAISALRYAGINYVPSGTWANDLVVYNDDGGLYQFGDENPGGTFGPASQTATLQHGAWIEQGPWRWHYQVTVEIDGSGIGGGFTRRYAIDYIVVEYEPQLRVQVTGAAPATEYSVLTRFPMVGPGGAVPDGIAHGTPYHWDDAVLDTGWDGPTFRATHDFAIATAATRPVAAIYHVATPAWSVYGNALIGCLLRNSQANNWGAGGSDNQSHTVAYAIRPGGDLVGPESGQPLVEALRYHTPLIATPIPRNVPAGAAAVTGSLAAVTATPGFAMIRASRPQQFNGTNPDSYTENASIVLRVYSPGNQPCAIRVELPAPPLDQALVTSLEQPIPGAIATTSASSVSFHMPTSQASLAVRLARPPDPAGG